jgi:hypothetical protein
VYSLHITDILANHLAYGLANYTIADHLADRLSNHFVTDRPTLQHACAFVQLYHGV